MRSIFSLITVGSMACTSVTSVDKDVEFRSKNALEIYCEGVDPSISAVLKGTALDIQFTIEDSKDVAYFDSEKSVIYINRAHRVDRKLLCTHELFHVVLSKVPWKMTQISQLMLLLNQYVNSKSNTANNLGLYLMHKYELVTENLYVIDVYLQNHPQENILTAELVRKSKDFFRLVKLHREVLINPLMHNIDLKVRGEILEILTKVEEYFLYLVDLTEDLSLDKNEDMVLFRRKINELLPVVAAMKTQYFYLTGVGEFLVQMLTVLFVDPTIAKANNLMSLNEDQLQILLDLEIQGLDLRPYILEYQKRNGFR